MSDYYTCAHGQDRTDCGYCDREAEERQKEIARRYASREVRWFAVTDLGRFRMEANHEVQATRLARGQPGKLKRVVKETRETIWEAT